MRIANRSLPLGIDMMAGLMLTSKADWTEDQRQGFKEWEWVFCERVSMAGLEIETVRSDNREVAFKCRGCRTHACQCLFIFA